MTNFYRWDEITSDDPEHVAAVAEEVEKLNALLTLYELRKRRKITQVELARRMGVKQKRVSEIEHAENLTWETLRNYARALGGDIEVRFIFPDAEPVTIHPLAS